jgi:hypothetical protein
MIKSIFAYCLRAAGFTHVLGHSVPGTTLPPGDANSIFIADLACQCCEEDCSGLT